MPPEQPQDQRQSVTPSVAPEVGLDLLANQYYKGKRLLDNRPLKPWIYESWLRITQNHLVQTFGSESPNIPLVLDRVYPPGAFKTAGEEAVEPQWEEERAALLEGQCLVLEGLIELLELTIRPRSQPSPIPETEAFGNKVFIVHGRDEAVLQTVARFIERLGLEVVILRDEPNRGRTIIEKFVDYSGVGFAIVLLTPDDRGGLADVPYEQQSKRARQNVILDLGFFLGKLGRMRVCALYREGVEVPSDYSGILFASLDDPVTGYV